MDKIKVIIADDSDFVRDGMRIILEVDEEFEVIGCARNGREAIEIAKESTPDIFLMDIQMPEMDGIEATKYIVENNLSSTIISPSSISSNPAIILKVVVLPQPEGPKNEKDSP